MIERLNDGHLDIVLAPEQINLFQDNLIQHKLFDDQLAVFARPRHSLTTSGEGIDPDQLSGRKWIAIGALSGIYGSQKEILTGLGAEPATASITFTGDVVMAAEILKRTDALCIMPRVLARLSGVLAGVREVPLQVELPSRNIVLWCRRSERHRADILDFQKRLESYLSGVLAGQEA